MSHIRVEESRHYLRAQSQGHHSSDRLEERGGERGNVRRSSSTKDERGPSSVRETLEPFQRQCCGTSLETGWSAFGLFRAHRYHLELTELNYICGNPILSGSVSLCKGAETAISSTGKGISFVES